MSDYLRCRRPVAVCLVLSHLLLLCGGIWSPAPRESVDAKTTSGNASTSDCAGRGCGCSVSGSCATNCCCKPRGTGAAAGRGLRLKSDTRKPTQADTGSRGPSPVLAWEAAACRGEAAILLVFTCIAESAVRQWAADDTQRHRLWVASPLLPSSPDFPPPVPPA